MEDLAKLKTQVALLQKDAKTGEQIHQRLEVAIEKLTDITVSLKGMLVQQETKLQRHDLGQLAYNKPGLVVKIINKASNNANRCIAIATGSPLTEDEINAVKKSQINGECPSLANPNYVQ